MPPSPHFSTHHKLRVDDAAASRSGVLDVSFAQFTLQLTLSPYLVTPCAACAGQLNRICTKNGTGTDNYFRGVVITAKYVKPAIFHRWPELDYTV